MPFSPADVTRMLEFKCMKDWENMIVDCFPLVLPHFSEHVDSDSNVSHLHFGGPLLRSWLGHQLFYLRILMPFPGPSLLQMQALYAKLDAARSPLHCFPFLIHPSN